MISTGPASERAIIAIDAMLDERSHQDKKHGTIQDHPHTIGEWIIIIEAELNEAKLALIKHDRVGRDSCLSEIVQVGASALACLEQHGISGPSKKWGR